MTVVDEIMGTTRFIETVQKVTANTTRVSKSWVGNLSVPDGKDALYSNTGEEGTSLV
jgi:hypothetical protein